MDIKAKLLKTLKKHWIKIAIALVVFLLFIKWTNISQGIAELRNLHLIPYIIACLTIVVVQLSKNLRFYYLAQDLKLEIGFWQTLRAHFIVPIIGRVTPAKLGEGMKIFMLCKARKELGFVFIMEKLTDTCTLLIISLFSIYTFGSYVNIWLGIAAVMVLMLVMLFNIGKILNFFLKKNIFEDQWFLNQLKKVSPMQWIAFLGYSTLIRFLVLSVPFIILLSLDMPLPLWLVFQMYGLSMVIGNISGLPGGIGSREFSYAFLLLTYGGLGKETAGVAALLVVFTDLMVESVLALIGLAMRKSKT